MKAILCKAFGLPDTLTLEEVPSPVPGPGEVLTQVKACSLNFPDTLTIRNMYQFKPPLPFSPGSESSGIVIAVGAGVTHVKPGDRVLRSGRTADWPRNGFRMPALPYFCPMAWTS